MRSAVASARSCRTRWSRRRTTSPAALLGTGRVDQALYDAARAHLGDGGLVELVTLAGYYTLVSFTLNAFDVPLPEGESYAFANGR